MATRLGPSDRWLERMLQKGITDHQDLADRWFKESGNRVARGTIASLIHRAGLSRDRTRYRLTEMWSPIKREHGLRYTMYALRYLQRQLDGEELDEVNAGRVRSFLAGVGADGVVAYVPSTPIDEDPYFILDRNEVPAELIDHELPVVTQPLTRQVLSKIAHQRSEDILADSARVVHPKDNDQVESLDEHRRHRRG